MVSITLEETHIPSMAHRVLTGLALVFSSECYFHSPHSIPPQLTSFPRLTRTWPVWSIYLDGSSRCSFGSLSLFIQIPPHMTLSKRREHSPKIASYVTR